MGWIPSTEDGDGENGLDEFAEEVCGEFYAATSAGLFDDMQNLHAFWNWKEGDRMRDAAHGLFIGCFVGWSLGLLIVGMRVEESLLGMMVVPFAPDTMLFTVVGGWIGLVVGFVRQRAERPAASREERLQAREAAVGSAAATRIEKAQAARDRQAAAAQAALAAHEEARAARDPTGSSRGQDEAR